MENKKKLTRSKTDVKIAGVCAGVAEYFGWDANIVRLILVAFCLFGGSGVLLYIAGALLIPQADDGVVDAGPDDLRDL